MCLPSITLANLSVTCTKPFPRALSDKLSTSFFFSLICSDLGVASHFEGLIPISNNNQP